MAQFILGNSAKDTLNKHPFIRDTIWRLESLVLGALLKLLTLLPIETVAKLGKTIGRSIGPHMPKHKSIVRNLSMAFPDKSPEEIAELSLQVWENAGTVLTEYANVNAIVKTDRLEVIISDKITAFDQNKQAIIVSAHFSNWEIIGPVVTGFLNSVYAPYTPPSNPWLDKKLRAYREPFGLELLPRDESIRPMVQCLAKGHSMALLMDQRVDSGEPIEFFGKDKLTTTVPARLALKFKCEIIPVRVQRLGNASYRMTFCDPILPESEGLDPNEQVTSMTLRINQLFESWIKENPGEWFCSNRMWSKDLERK